MNIQLIIKIALIAITILEIGFMVIIKLKQVEKNKLAEQKYVKYLSLLTSIVPEAIEIAEKCGLQTKELKHLVAINEIKEECFKEGIEYKDYATAVDDFLERLIEFSKKVNVKNTRCVPYSAQEVNKQ